VLFLFHQPFLQVKTESLALKGFMRVDSVSLLSTRQRQNDLRDQIHREFVNRPFQFHKRSQLFVGLHNEPLSVAAMCASNPDRSPVGITIADTQPKHCSRSHDVVIHVYDDAGNVIETHEHAGDFNEP